MLATILAIEADAQHGFGNHTVSHAVNSGPSLGLCRGECEACHDAKCFHGFGAISHPASKKSPHSCKRSTLTRLSHIDPEGGSGHEAPGTHESVGFPTSRDCACISLRTPGNKPGKIQ